MRLTDCAAVKKCYHLFGSWIELFVDRIALRRVMTWSQTFGPSISALCLSIDSWMSSHLIEEVRFQREELPFCSGPALWLLTQFWRNLSSSILLYSCFYRFVRLLQLHPWFQTVITPIVSLFDPWSLKLYPSQLTGATPSTCSCLPTGWVSSISSP